MQLVQYMPEVEHTIVLLCKLHIVKGCHCDVKCAKGREYEGKLFIKVAP